MALKRQAEEQAALYSAQLEHWRVHLPHPPRSCAPSLITAATSPPLLNGNHAHRQDEREPLFRGRTTACLRP